MAKGRKVVVSQWMHTYKGDGHEKLLESKSIVAAKEFTQVQDGDYHEAKSPTPA